MTCELKLKIEIELNCGLIFKKTILRNASFKVCSHDPIFLANYYSNLLPDCMFIRKKLQSDWLDSGQWTIYTFPYRRSGPFIRFSIKVKTQDFWKITEKISTELMKN